ncbi:MAG TPA: methyltransferase domain-containing protein [Thermoanaerobaculia bacterium]|jgi:SAM-dependent methyltransferase|nr:methyltransferase domain-containing protein [Thermoanaerobaculia bacterium]
MDATTALYEEKEGGYFRAARLDLLGLLPPSLSQGGGLRLLELGAGDGATLRAARERGLASYTVGIDLVEPPGGAPGVDRFIHGNVEALELDLPAGGFDAVLCADVLEHLVDPWRTVARLADLLRPGGVLLSSIPNVRNHRVLRPLVLRGDFRYQPAGLMDRSHLRFFCRENARELFEGAGLTVEAMAENMGAYGLRHRLVDRLTLGLLHDFFVFQFLTRARKP